MTVECLYAESRLHIPERDCLISTSRGEDVREWLVGDLVDRVHMTSESISVLANIQIEQLACMIHRGGNQEVARVIDINGPHRLDVV